MEDIDLTTVYLSGYYDGEKKWKIKIKEKIKEAKELLTSNIISDRYSIEINNRIRVLEEILEEKQK